MIVEDLDPTHKWISYMIKIWADKFAFLAEEKGASRWIRPKHIIVTSQYMIEQIWDDEETQEAIRRRFEVKEFTINDRISN